MTRSRSGKILIVDNDALVNIMSVYESNPQVGLRVFQNLALLYSRIWIPGEVRKEFLLKRNDKRRKKTLRKIIENHPSISICPITVGINEIKLLTGIKDENRGEADAVIQTQKAKANDRLSFDDIVFFSNDKAALQMALARSISILSYADFRSKMLEAGMILPNS